ncbi:hypothetical protein H6P81_008387 [Aristolochia fimbriata]|uniref:Uncharacterized protein n=1 Tax=Aristolochia fimbriata TaxID=158543 RepID=A0AAV7F339_ARIFI|nr:hypothetical protein H6P81_008387 [Aristolochia fimbriata]
MSKFVRSIYGKHTGPSACRLLVAGLPTVCPPILEPINQQPIGPVFSLRHQPCHWHHHHCHYQLTNCRCQYQISKPPICHQDRPSPGLAQPKEQEKESLLNPLPEDRCKREEEVTKSSLPGVQQTEQDPYSKHQHTNSPTLAPNSQKNFTQGEIEKGRKVQSREGTN